MLVRSIVEINYSKQQTFHKNNSKLEDTKRFNSDNLRNGSISFLYKLRLAHKLQEDIKGTEEDIYETFKNKIHKAAVETLEQVNR